VKKVAIFGGTGFIGSYLTDELLTSNYRIKLLVRNINDALIKNNTENVNGVLSDASAVNNTIKGSDIVIYAVGIIRENRSKGSTFEKLHYEYFKNIVDISKNHDIQKIIYISANGVSEKDTAYQTTKYKAEQYLQNNFDIWLIFRPSVVFGDPRGKMEFMTQLANDIMKKPIPAPLFFDYNPFNTKKFFKSNPIHIKNLSEIIVKSIEDDTIRNTIFELGGPDVVNWKTLLKTISKTLNRKKIFLPIPISFFSIAAKLLDRFQFFPITNTQIEMLKEGNTCNSEEIFKKLSILPIPFSTDSIKYLK
jgi:NADH dehydrogenase